ncbi:endonuclease IV [Megasphaera cerevisiae DSM 20462]|jgi:deoxyribonuclease-4|uniref:Probable endonuclease 4 n=1 Tax=Megasphaera cerevisiae DSM 20462 TaxID=1122219 RepID=A0A0J6WX37_9FIRM|nr:deoxyribonuclease IV [Megasphaera cerevisiae]KMO87184.1 endonuclease IV [Megasphaera cerevisiae DSM 20462]MCI1750866.1 deoxyribonuclease IV [Megasphaera cerevisiae]OKY54184.1 endonuclease IV [Megasphaera cerevisiae]SJZ59998.1 Endonuclease IV [Megasphaera cerevisiae DSM 20462]
MLHIGCHLSVSQGFLHMGQEALSIGADTFQFFTRNPRGGSVRRLDIEDMEALNELLQSHHFAPVLAHAPYTLNGCSKTERTRQFAVEVMTEDLRRLEHLDNCRYNFHPGSHVGQGAKAGIGLIAEMLNQCMFQGQRTTVLLETMAGKGTEVGRNFEELAAVMDKVGMADRLGVCLDTCHVFDGGYDIVYRLDEVLEAFDRIIGLNRLKAVHINDSKNNMGSHKDRHEKIGEGYIGMEAFGRIINHPALRQLPFYLETPNDLEGYAREIQLLRRAYMEK